MSRNSIKNGEILQNCDWFISEYAALEENDYRIELLRKIADNNYLNTHRRYSNADLNDLADKLDRCNTGEIKCTSPACKRCNRTFQIERVNKIVQSMLSAIKIEPELRFGVLTLIEYEYSLDAYDFVNFDIQMDKERLRKLFLRSGVSGPVLGAFELDFHSTQQLWLPHYHLLVPLGEQNNKPIETLCRKVGVLHPVHIDPDVLARPTMIQIVKDVLKQISYIYKLACFEVRDYKNSLGKRRTKKYRLNDLLFSESLCWLDEIGRRKMLFEYKARGWIK